MLRICPPDTRRFRFSAASSRFLGGWRAALAGQGEVAADSIDRLITERRVRGYSTICLVVWLVSLSASVLLGHPPRNVLDKVILPDYLAHWTGGRLLLEGAAEHLYDVPTQLALQIQTVGEHETFAWYVNPPFIAVLYALFAALPYPSSALAWTVFAVLLLFASARLLRSLVPGLGGRRWRTALLVAAATPPVYELIGSGQDSALSVFLWLVGIRLALARRDDLAGLTFALGLYKPQLFLLPPLLFLCWWRRRALLGWALTAGLLGTASLLLVGPGGIRTWLALPVSPAYQESIQAGQAWKMQTISALLTAGAPPQFASLAEALGLVLGIVLVAAFVRQALRCRWEGGSDEAPLWGLACLTTLLASPHLALYDLVLLIFPALLLVERRNERGVRLALVAIIPLTWTLPARHLLVGSLPWPLPALGASWTAIPVLVLWIALSDLLSQPPRRVAASCSLGQGTRSASSEERRSTQLLKLPRRLSGLHH
jgi:hypothetical protein